MVSMLFIVLAICLIIGVPVGFSIGISTAAYVLLANSQPLTIVIQRMVDGINSFSYLALPLFILSGALMVFGSTPRLMRFANLLLGRIPGGLGAAGALGCGFFGAISGSGVATTASIGSIVAPEMVNQGYDKGFTASLIAAAGTLGVVIPPSVCMVVYAQNASVSIGSMFLAGFIPGFAAIALLGLLSVFIAKRRHYRSAAAESHTVKEIIYIVIDALLPLLMPVIILGGVLSGVFTPTESASIATVYAFILAKFVYKELSWKNIVEVLKDSVRSSACILFIIAAATPFGWLITMENVTSTISNAILSTISSPALIYISIVAVLVVLGTFMESFTIIILTTPIFLPIITGIGVNPIAYGIVLMLCICVGAVTPPLAVCLFTSCRIIKIRIEETIPDVFMVIAILLLVAAFVMAFPSFALWLTEIF